MEVKDNSRSKSAEKSRALSQSPSMERICKYEVSLGQSATGRENRVKRALSGAADAQMDKHFTLASLKPPVLMIPTPSLLFM